MSLTNALNAAVSGLNASATQFRVAVNNVVNANTENFTAKEIRYFSQIGDQSTGGVRTAVVEIDDVDLASEFITMTEAKITYAANAKVIAVTEKIFGATLDITA